MSKQVKMLRRITFYFIENNTNSVSSSRCLVFRKNFEFLSLQKKRQIIHSVVSNRLECSSNLLNDKLRVFLNYLNRFSRMKWNNNNSYRIKTKNSTNIVSAPSTYREVETILNSFGIISSDLELILEVPSFSEYKSFCTQRQEKTKNRSGMK